MLNLLAKDFKLLFRKEKSVSKRIITSITTLAFIAFFIAIEVFLFSSILKKVGTTKEATSAFTSLFLFIISLLIIVSDLLSANKLFFNEKDIEQLSIRPVSNTAIICSKLIFLFLMHYALSFIFTYPIFLSYGIIKSKSVMFYYSGIFYPVMTFFIEMGIALLFVYPFWLLKKYLSKHVLIRFIIVVAFLVVFSLLYAQVLNAFIEIVVGGNFNRILTKIPLLVKLQKYEFPTNFIVKALFEKQKRYFYPYLTIGIGIFVLGASVAIFAYNYVRNISINIKSKNREEMFKVASTTKALFKKEFFLIARNGDYAFSFLGLLMVQPFLAYMVIKAINTIFSNGAFAYYISIVPNFLPLMDILLLMLFTVIISGGASQYIQMEKKTIKVMKTIPITPLKQLLIKVSIPCALSELSLVVTLFVLLITKTIGFMTFISAFILVTLLLVTFDLVSLKEELSIRNNRRRSNFLSSLYAYALPVLYFLATATLSYFGLPIVVAYLIGFLVLVLAGVPMLIYLKKHLNSLFMDLDVVN